MDCAEKEYTFLLTRFNFEVERVHQKNPEFRKKKIESHLSIIHYDLKC